MPALTNNNRSGPSRKCGTEKLEVFKCPPTAALAAWAPTAPYPRSQVQRGLGGYLRLGHHHFKSVFRVHSQQKVDVFMHFHPCISMCAFSKRCWHWERQVTKRAKRFCFTPSCIDLCYVYTPLCCKKENAAGNMLG